MRMDAFEKGEAWHSLLDICREVPAYFYGDPRETVVKCFGADFDKIRFLLGLDMVDIRLVANEVAAGRRVLQSSHSLAYF